MSIVFVCEVGLMFSLGFQMYGIGIMQCAYEYPTILVGVLDVNLKCYDA